MPKLLACGRTVRLALILLAPLLLASSSSLAVETVEACTAAVEISGIDGDQKKCCKVCRRGKACGDSCIAKNKRCTKSPGCACNG